ncbi:MAG: aminotransferase class III-fold pyridoxal phosphate-dependent enzyme, partial [Simkaniaceae bacterium]|nr:aminotransferase class III-fold pyridoxal phosphate-dependent enzyme [Simkaniaceae bacterium]
ACVILEPIMGNYGCVIPSREFLLHLKQECRRVGAVLIFDEVITGFRVGLQGAAGYFGIEPDLTTFGKIIGGGFPVAAVAGRVDLMDELRPLGSVFQGGTLSGNPIGMVAGYETLSELEKPAFYEALENKGKMLTEGLQVSRIGSMFSFTGGLDFAPFFAHCFENKIFIPPSINELCFVSAAHSTQELKMAHEIFTHDCM